MEQYILFRSRKIRTHISGESNILHPGRGTDVSDIASYTPGDDIRDISWRHSARTPSLYTKIRAESDTFPIIGINTLTEKDGFFTKEAPISTYHYAKNLIDIFKLSAKKYHFPWREQVLPNTENTMIILIGHSLTPNLYKKYLPLAIKNDLVFIHIFHPEEYHISKNHIFGGFGVNKAAYARAWVQSQSDLKTTIEHSGGSYLGIDTETPIARAMNIFFKKRNQYASPHFIA